MSSIFLRIGPKQNPERPHRADQAADDQERDKRGNQTRPETTGNIVRFTKSQSPLYFEISFRGNGGTLRNHELDSTVFAANGTADHRVFDAMLATANITLGQNRHPAKFHGRNTTIRRPVRGTRSKSDNSSGQDRIARMQDFKVLSSFPSSHFTGHD